MKKILLFAFIITIFAFGCKEENQKSKGTGTGTLSVHLIDAPAVYEQVLVDVQGLKINVSETEEEEGSWQDLTLKETVTEPIDLLTLTDGNSIWLAEEELPVGYISQMRMILGSNNHIVVDGIPNDLATPSAQQSGLKFNIHATIEEGETLILIIDFDAEKSVVEKGNGTYSLKPVITVTTGEEDAEEATVEE